MTDDPVVTATVAVRMPVELLEEVRVVCGEDDVTVSQLVRRLLRAHVAQRAHCASEVEKRAGRKAS